MRCSRESHVVGVGRLRHNDLVARVQAAHESEKHGFGAARGDDDLVWGHVDVELGIIVDKLLAIG